MQKKVFISWDIPQIGIDLLEKEGFLVEIWKGDTPISQDELISKVQDCQALLSQSSDKLNDAFFNQCKHLEVVSQFSVGYDNIDLASAAHYNIPLGNAPGAMTEATADIAFGLMIAVSRKFFFMHKQIVKNAWKINPPQAFLGQDLRGKTLGIFGLGKIGYEMAYLCKQAFQMNIIYHNRRAVTAEMESTLAAKYVSFDDLLSQSDVISVHAALTPETKGVFNENTFNKMKKNAIFINTSRGGLVDEIALTEALQKKIIWGAGLDVTNPEPMQHDNVLLHMENVCVLPHIGSATIGARNNMSRMAAENIVSFFKSGILKTPISK